MTRPESTVDLLEESTVELTVGAVAHGGHCVARYEGLVVFVRHALPGERVRARVTEVRRDYARADAVEIVEPSPDRVAPPCPYARPGGCGGCDLQHASAAAQLEWKAAVVREQLARLAGLTPPEIEALGVRVEALPGGSLGWRTRLRYAIDATGRAGLLKHRSHEVVPIDTCRIAHPAIQALPVTARQWPEADEVLAVAPSIGAPVVVPVGGPRAAVPSVRERAVGREWTLPADGFWQVHPAAADALVNAVVELLAPRPGETAWDLYGGAGLFAAALVPPAAAVTLVESSRVGAAAARANLADRPQVSIVEGRVNAVLRRRGLDRPVDLVVLDPPRSGAGAAVVRAIADSGARAVAYVACDPAAFARDARTFAELGWRLARLRAYDCFPMTHHVELVALMTPTGGR